MSKSKIQCNFRYLETLSQIGIADLTENLWEEDDVRQLCVEYELETGSEESMREGLKKYYASLATMGYSPSWREYMLDITDLWNLIDLARTCVSDMSRKRQTLYEWLDCPDRSFNVHILIASQTLRRTFYARIEAARETKASKRGIRAAKGQSRHEWQDIYDGIEDQHSLISDMSVEIDEFVRLRDYGEAKKEQERACVSPPTPTPICDWHNRNQHDSSGSDRWFGYDHDGD